MHSLVSVPVHSSTEHTVLTKPLAAQENYDPGRPAYEWLNWNVVQALCVKEGILDSSNAVGNIFPLALERNYRPDQIRILEGEVLALTPWIYYLSDVLRAQMSSDSGQGPNLMHETDGLYQGQLGQSVERWNFWKSRLLELGQTLETDEVKDAALKAAELM